MPFQNFSDGFYLLRQKSVSKGVDHYGIMDVGNRLQLPEVPYGSQPVIIHQTPPSIRLDWLESTGTWEVLGRINDEQLALGRIREAVKNPKYALFSNNCEQFARFIATGRRESQQVNAACFVGFAALSVYALSRKAA